MMNASEVQHNGIPVDGIVDDKEKLEARAQREVCQREKSIYFFKNLLNPT